MAYKEPFTIENSLMKIFVLVFYILNSVPCVGTSAMKRLFFCTTFEVFFLTRLIWYELIFFLGEILNHLGLAVVSGLELKMLKDAASRENFFLHETIKRFFYNSGKFERISPSIQIFFVATGRNYT